MGQYYNFKNIFTLLSDGFSVNDLKNLCFTEDTLRDVYKNLPENAVKDDVVRNIIDFATQNLAIEIILDWAKEKNPARFYTHEPYFAEQVQEDNVLVKICDDNHIGFGIHLGGKYQGIPLKMAATQWAQYGGSKVCSGWLFISQLTESHAVTFFKIHVSTDGKGYVHLTDVSHPAHLIYLSTTFGFYKEKEFHFQAAPMDIWHFTWNDNLES